MGSVPMFLGMASNSISLEKKKVKIYTELLKECRVKKIK